MESFEDRTACQGQSTHALFLVPFQAFRFFYASQSAHFLPATNLVEVKSPKQLSYGMGSWPPLALVYSLHYMRKQTEQAILFCPIKYLTNYNAVIVLLRWANNRVKL